MSAKVQSKQTKEPLVKKWYVLRVVNGKEKKIKQYIDSEISRLGIRIMLRRF